MQEAETLSGPPMAAGCAPPEEASIAFFGAVDSRPYLFYMVISLLSAHRFHPAAGYFVLVPPGKAAEWEGYAASLSEGNVRLLDLPEEAEGNFAATEERTGYSRFTFHRHAVPQLLIRRGFAYSINMDPDVLCTRPWDWSVLLQVELIGGRRVGSTKRTLEWLQTMMSGSCTEPTNGGEQSRCSEAAVKARQETAKMLLTGGSLGVTPASLSKTPELNGGVLVFNNLRAVREDWLARCLALYGYVRDIVEGDQDLLSLVLASNLSLPRAEMPTVYNYAFRRDRERLPHAIGRQLRHGMFVQVAVNVHFVQDGKPWQWQNLTVYPMWLLAARAYHAYQWIRLAKSRSPALAEVKWSKKESLSFASTDTLLRSTSRPTLSSVLDLEALRLCRCFLRGITKDKKADQVLQEQAAAAKARSGSGQGDASEVEDPIVGRTDASIAAYRDRLIREREELLEACSDGMAPSAQERAMCTEEWNVPTGSAGASTAARLALRHGGTQALSGVGTGTSSGAAATLGRVENSLGKGSLGKSGHNTGTTWGAGPKHAKRLKLDGKANAMKALKIEASATALDSDQAYARRANSSRTLRRHAHGHARESPRHSHAHTPHPRNAIRMVPDNANV